MKILLVCENFFPHYGGAEVLFKNLAEGYVKAGHNVSIVTRRLPGTQKKEKFAGVSIKRVFSFFSRYGFTFFSIPKVILEAKKADIIQTTTFNAALPSWIAGKLLQKPVVLTVHEVWIGKWKEITGFSAWKSKIHDLLERGIYLLPFDKYICVSQATKRDLLLRKIPEQKIEQVYNGFDYSSWQPEQFNEAEVIKIKKNLNLTEKFVYFSWGRPGESKGFEYLIQAAPLIKEKIPQSMFLLMLGSPEKYKRKYSQLRQLIAELSVQDYVKVIPSVPSAELGCYIKAADCIVIPSLSEGFGYTTVEACALEKLILISNAGSLPEIVSGKYNIFRRKDAVDLAEKAVSCAKGTYAETPLRKFNWEDTIKGYLQIYDLLLYDALLSRK